MEVLFSYHFHQICRRGRHGVSRSERESSSRHTDNNKDSNKENDSPLPKYKRDLVQKMKVLRNELQAMQPQAGHCRVEVSREEIFEVDIIKLLDEVCLLTPNCFYHKLY